MGLWNYERDDEQTMMMIARLQAQVDSRATSQTARTTTTAPPSPRVAATLSAATNGYTFSYYEVPGTFGYNIYRNTTNDPTTATKIDFIPTSVEFNPLRNKYIDEGTDPELSSGTTRTYTDNPGVTSYYWVAPVNDSRLEGTRIAMQGTTVPSPGVGTGVQSLNALTAATQTFATGTAGTNFAISSAGSTHTFNLPDASASNRGAVTTGTQTLAGTKTFSGAVLIGAATSATTGAITMKEIAAPSAPAADEVYIYAQDNGAGKTQLMALFSSGAAQQIAIQP